MDGVKAGAKPRFDALDGVRAAAMLAGVYFHAIQFAMLSGSQDSGPMGAGGDSASLAFQEYLHSFRMPLFFLISGFFCRMMREKYGTRLYLARRWSRIGVPLLIGLFAIVPVYQMTRVAIVEPAGPPESAARAEPVASPAGLGVKMSPSTVVGPSRPTPIDGDGSPGAGKWEEVPMPLAETGEPGLGARSGGALPFGLSGVDLGARLFGPATRLFRLEFLWFLWYLMIFATAAPWLARFPGWSIRRESGETADRVGRRALALGLAPMALGLAGGLLLLGLPNATTWTLPTAAGVFRGVPDFLLRPERDMPFYLAYFLAGWWLHRISDALPTLARLWLPSLLVGLAAHRASGSLYEAYGHQTQEPRYDAIRLGGFLLYGIGSAYTAFGFLGVFQRFLDQPTRIGRYLADTALWVYLIHLPLLRPSLAAATPLGLPWWAEGALVSAMDAGMALMLYEVFIRPTPLARIFGPGGGSKPRPAATGTSRGTRPRALAGDRFRAPGPI